MAKSNDAPGIPEKKPQPLEKPELKRLGDLKEMTQGMGGTGFDGGSGMSRP